MTTTTPGVGLDLQRDAASRQERLSASMRALRTRAGTVDPSRTLLIAGGVLIPLGFAFIIMGWWGAAHTARLFEQIPYSISGGMLGMALVFAGGFAYFAYWLTQLVHAVRHEAESNGATLERIEDLLATLAANGGMQATAASTPARGRGTRAGGKSASFIATAHGTMFHRPDCQAVSGQSGVRKVTGTEKGLTPCKICEPLSA